MRVESSPATQSLGHKSSVVRKIFMLVLGVALLTSFFASIAASATENVFKITNTSFVEASQNVEEDFEATDEASISDALLFHKIGDYAKFRITFKNSDSINHVIESITDDNENEYVSLEYADYAGTTVNAGDSFDFLLTIKYNAAVDNINNRDQISNFKLYIKYAESEEPDEIDVDPSSPDTSDNFKIAVTVLVISATGLIVCLITAKRIGRKTVKIIAIIAIVASAFVISHNTQAASEGTDVIVFSSEFNLYDKLVITLSNDGEESTITVDYNSTVSSIAKPEAPTGYEFDTWKDENGNPISDSAKLTEDTKLFAGYKIITYTIRYEGLESGEEQGLPTEYNIETSVTIAPITTRKDDDGDDSETFTGWKDENDVVSQTVTIPTGQTGDRTFEATWEDVPLTTYTATCNLNGGQGTDSYTFNKKTETFAIQNPTKDFYDFKGWSGTDLVGEENTNVQVVKGTRKNLQFEAHYTPTNYTISYIGLNDSELTDRPTSYNYESTIHLENPADRFDSDGDKTQSFDGWSSTDITIADNKDVTFQNEHGNKTFKANWTTVAPTEYTVTYNYNNSEDPGNETKFTKYESINVINPTRDYYIFAGWTGEGISITDPMDVTIPVGTRNNVTLNATWTPVEYDITYANLTETESANFTKKYTVESDPISLTNPAERVTDDEHFVNWTSSDVDVSNPSSIVVADKHKDITITANWEANTHSLSIDLNGGTTEPNNPTSFTKNTETFTLIEPTKNGYEFKGWSGTGLDGDSNKNVQVAKGTKEDLSFAANYTAINYSIEYEGVTAEEKAAKELPESYTIETAKTIAKLDDRFDSDGDKTQRFVGWQTEGQSDTSETVSIPLGTTGNKSYTAIWENVDLPSYNIAYNSLEGATDPGNKTSYKKTDPDYTLTNPIKTGYNFDGWTCEQLEVSTPTTNFVIPQGTRGALAIEAHFSPIHYTVEFNINTQETIGEGDDVEINNLTCTYDSDCIIPNKTLNLVGYTFNGWNTQADGNGTPYAKGANFTNITTTDGDTITLYAQWTPKDDIPYTIQFYFENINDDDFTIDNSKTIDNLSGTANTTASVDPANYSFDHFTYTSDQSVTESNIDRHGNTILKLYYTRNTYNITFNANGGTISGTEIFEGMKYGATISKDDFPTATQSGSDFAGWFTEADGGQKITDDITVEGTDTIYAHWTPSEVTLCKKATELHVETCRNNAGGCKDTGYTVMNYSTDPPTVAKMGAKGTSDIVYGNISDGDSAQKGDAFDCDVNGDGDYDSNTERFYYIRSTEDKAILIYSNNFQNGAPGYTENYNYVPAIAQLPTTQQWTALTDVATTYDNNRIARFLNIEDLSSACSITSLSDNRAFPETCSFMLENTSYFAPSDAIAKSGIWTDVTNGDDSKAFRIHSSTLKFTYMGKNGSKNVARPIIEIPIDQLDNSDVEVVTISFNTQGGNTLQPFDMGKGNPLRFREQDYTPTRAGYTFKGWCLDSECETEPNYSTIINSDTTLYAKWEEMNTIAAIGSTGYPSLAAAIAAVPTTEEATEVVLLKSTSESTITTSAGQNIILNLQDETFTASNKNALQLSDGSKLKLVSGTIKSSQNDGAINVNQGSEFEMTGGTINVSKKQAIYVNGGTATIYGGNIISTSAQRAAIHNACSSSNTPACTNTTGGVINILGGTIQNSEGIAIKNEKGTLNIGTHDGYVETSTPHIIGKTIGVVAGSSFRFYDGTIEGETWPVGTNDTTADTNYTKIAGIETDSELIKDHDSTPKKIYLAPTTGTGQ